MSIIWNNDKNIEELQLYQVKLLKYWWKKSDNEKRERERKRK